MIDKILSISGKSGLFRLVSRGKNMLICESLIDGHRCPALQRDKLGRHRYVHCRWRGAFKHRFWQGKGADRWQDCSSFPQGSCRQAARMVC